MNRISLLESARQHILATLPHRDAKVATTLAAMLPAELMIVYVNWRMRFVAPRPRTLLPSDAWARNPAHGGHAAELAEAMREIEQGADLTARLSRRLQTGFTLGAAGRKSLGSRHRPDIDLLLNDWGVHHLHIGLRQPDGNVPRGALVALVLFRPDAAYLIDICDHHSWARGHVAEAIIRNWPDHGFFSELTGVRPPSEPGLTDEERKEMRDAGIMNGITVDGKMYVPTTLFALGGSNARINREAMLVLETLQRFEANYDESVGRLRFQLAERGVRLSEKPVFEFRFYLDGFGLHEVTEQIDIGLGQWRFVQ